MSLIQKQELLVAALEVVHRKRIARGGAGMAGDLAGARSRAIRKHIEEMRAAGYSQREAAESGQQCNDVAALNAGSEA